MNNLNITWIVMVLGFLPLSKLRFVMFSIDARYMFDLWPFRLALMAHNPLTFFVFSCNTFSSLKTTETVKSNSWVADKVPA